MSERRHPGDGANAPEKGAFRVERDGGADRPTTTVRAVLRGPDDGYAPYVLLSLEGGAGGITDEMMPSEAFELAHQLTVAALAGIGDCGLAMAATMAGLPDVQLRALLAGQDDSRAVLLDLTASETAIAWLESHYPAIGEQLVAHMTEESHE